MFKVTILMKRAPPCAPAAFAEAWARRAAETIEQLKAAAGALRFAQSPLYATGSPLAGLGDSVFDGAEEYWFDSEQSARAHLGRRPKIADAISGWADAAACFEVCGEVHPISDARPDAPDALKIIVGGARKPGMSVTDYRHHLINVHGPLAMANPEVKGPKPRVEYCPAEPVGVTGQPIAHYDSLAALWLAGTLEALIGAPPSPYYRDVLAPDERRFNDKDRSFSMIVAERQVWGSLPNASEGVGR